MAKEKQNPVLKLMQEFNSRMEHKDKSINDAQLKIYQLEKQIEKQEDNRNFNQKLAIEHGFVDKLMEIVRWQINPETAKYPYDKSIEQKTQRQKERDY